LQDRHPLYYTAMFEHCTVHYFHILNFLCPTNLISIHEQDSFSTNFKMTPTQNSLVLPLLLIIRHQAIISYLHLIAHWTFSAQNSIALGWVTLYLYPLECITKHYPDYLHIDFLVLTNTYANNCMFPRSNNGVSLTQ